MYKHRNHDCGSWENCEMVQHCVEVLKPYAMDTTEINKSIHKHCTELESALKGRFAARGECHKILQDVEKLFGRLSLKPDVTTPKKFEKMLKVVSNVLSHYDTNVHHNISLLTKLVESPGPFSEQIMIFPNVDGLVEEFFPISVEDCEDQGFGEKSAMEKMNAEETSPHFNVTWEYTIKFDFNYPFSLCSTPDGFVVVGDKGINRFSDQPHMHHQCFKGWPALPKRNAVVFPYLVVYHPNRGSLFITREIDVGNCLGELCEYSLRNLRRVKSHCLPQPNGKPLIAPLLIAVLSDGRIVCARGIDDRGCVWIKLLSDFNNDKWTNVWDDKILKKFDSLYVVKQNDVDILFIQSRTLVYEFVIMKDDLCRLRCSHDFFPYKANEFVVFKNDLYFCFKSVQMLLQCLSTDRIQMRLNLDSMGFRVLLFIDKDRIYYLNCDQQQKILKIGQVVHSV